MPTLPPRCRHLHTDGRQCGSPAVRHEKLCYQHHAARQRPTHTPTLPVPEDLHAVGRGLAELLHLVSRELIEDKQSKQLFLILTAAGTNLARIDRQQARARELNLRARALTLAEIRLAAQHPQAGLSGWHSRRESASLAEAPEETGCPTTEPGCPPFGAAAPRLRGALDHPEPPITDPVTDPVQDPLLGLIAPGLDPEPRPQPQKEPGYPIEEPGAGYPASSPKPQPDLPSRARQAELDAEAAEQIEFDRRENAWREENNRIRHDNYTIRYNLMVPEAQLAEDHRRAQLHAVHNSFELPLGPHPRWGITEQPF